MAGRSSFAACNINQRQLSATWLLASWFSNCAFVYSDKMQKNDDQGKFRQLDEITYVVGYPGYQHLSSVAENCMQVVCDVKGDNTLSQYNQFLFCFIMLDGMPSHIYGVFYR